MVNKSIEKAIKNTASTIGIMTTLYLTFDIMGQDESATKIKKEINGLEKQLRKLIQINVDAEVQSIMKGL